VERVGIKLEQTGIVGTVEFQPKRVHPKAQSSLLINAI